MPKAENRGKQKSFAPIVGENAKALILGSYPSPKSFEQGFYYGHPQNRFWPLLAALSGSPLPQTIEEKTALLVKHHLALWDSLESCTITGAADSSIKDPVPNEIGPLLAKTGIQAIFCNGTAAYTLYRRFCEPQSGVKATRLPSTSPANAACGMECLLKAWAPLKDYLF